MVDVMVESRKNRDEVISSNVTVDVIRGSVTESGILRTGDEVELEDEVICNVALEHVDHILVSVEEVPVETINSLTHFVSGVIDVTRFSTLTKLINTTGYVFRFINNLKARVTRRGQLIQDDTLRIEEFEFALKQWVKAEQWLLKKRKDFQKLKASLKLFEENDILRLKGRFTNASLEFNRKYPILLRGGESYFTKLVVLDAHQNVMHHGIETSLNYIRTKYWIIKG